MRILVTGGAGFIGSHLCATLLEQGHEVICADNFLSGLQDNVAPLKKRKGFTFKKHDITKPLSISGKLDRIYNLACPASPVMYQKHPIETLLASTQGVKNVLDLAKAKKARILQASTSEIYGDPEVHPQQEDYWGNVNPNGIRSCYDEGKRVAESFMMNYHEQYGVETRIVRIFNTYGPNMAADDGRVVSNFINQALAGEPITIYGDGSQTRSLCYVSDLVHGLMTVMESEEKRPVNLGNPAEITMRDLADEIIQLVKTIRPTSSEAMYKPLPRDDPRKRLPDIARANGLGWQPTTNRTQGLLLTIEFFDGKRQKRG